MSRGQVVIENPILNSPFEEPGRHFEFDDEGITDRVVEGRRSSSYFVPIPRARRRGGQLAFETEWTADRIEENAFINRVRERVGRWRQGGWQGVTPTTRALLEYWTDPERERRLFFCQVEALETAIYLTEVAHRMGDAWIDNQLRTMAEDANPGLFRVAHKMATGTGKTVVMAMLIAWHTLNKARNPQDRRFADAFLVVAPGITIKDRLRVLLPSDPENYYRERDIVPAGQFGELGRAKIVITNFHAFKLREKVKAPKLTKEIAGQAPGVFTETPDEMARRVCRGLGTKRQVVVLNDEAHHCYRRRQGPTEEDLDALTGQDKREATKRDDEARVWASGLEAVAAKYGIKAVYDLSATPFYLRGSGWPEGTLFQWVVSDFSLIDAIEAGLVKIPRVPVDDNASQAADAMPTYRNLWPRIRDGLPKKGRKTDAVDGAEPRLPGALQGALETLYGNYEKAYAQWEATAAGTAGATPPVFIVVCNNTNVSKLVFDYIAGWMKPLPDGSGSVVVPGRLPLFSNEQDGGWSARPKTILVDSTQLESGEGMSKEFKAAAAAEITEFKAELRQRFPGRDTDEISDEDLLREVMNTVGKPGKLGEQVRCVVSVSMLTEGWDANTVTHILGVRAFGTQLLCEQVVGRGLRRRSYALGDDGHFSPEYAEVYGVPFSFIPASGSAVNPRPGPFPTRVRALEDRAGKEITFPRLNGTVWQCSKGGGLNYFWANRSASLVFQGAVAEEDTILALHGSELSVIGSDEQVRYQIAMSTADEEAAPPRIEFVPGSGDSVTIDPSTLESFPVETCVDPGTGEECVLLTVRGIGPPQVGTINVTTGEATVPIPMTVDVDATLGYDGLPANCQIGPINGVFTSNDLDPTSGEATLEVQDLPLPEVTTCGDYNDFFNGVLSLPGSHVDGTINALIGL